MDIDRRLVAELGVAVAGLAAFIGAAYVVSAEYGTSANASANGSAPPVLQPDGGLAMIGAIVLFVLVMGAAGLMMYSLDFDDEDDEDGGDADQD